MLSAGLFTLGPAGATMDGPPRSIVGRTTPAGVLYLCIIHSRAPVQATSANRGAIHQWTEHSPANLLLWFALNAIDNINFMTQEIDIAERSENKP